MNLENQREEDLKRVAQLWNLPQHEKKEMDVEFGESIISLIEEYRQSWEREKKEFENFLLQFFDMNAICKERDRLKAEVQELREAVKPVESDEEAILEYLGNVTPALKRDVMKLCARIRADMGRPGKEAMTDEETVSKITNEVLTLYPDKKDVKAVSVMKTAYGFILKALSAQRQSWAREKAEKYGVTMGVGEGDGKMFVHGDYESIKHLQTKILNWEKVVAEKSALEKEKARLEERVKAIDQLCKAKHDIILKLRERVRKLEAKNTELENFPHQLLDVNAICEERDRFKAENERLREGVIDSIHCCDAEELIAQARQEERDACLRIIENHECDSRCDHVPGECYACDRVIAAAIRGQGRE